MNSRAKDVFFPDRSLSSISTESDGLASPTSPHDLLPPLAALFDPLGPMGGVESSGGSAHDEALRRLRQPRRLPAELDYSEGGAAAHLLEDHIRQNYLAYPSRHHPEEESLSSPNVPPSPVELMVTNLDQAIEQREIKAILQSLFEPFKARQINVFTQSDGNTSASVKMASLEDAQLAISRLHRSKVGSKRILINYNNVNVANPAILRKKVMSILKEVPEGRLQLFKFRDMYEKRYAGSIGVSDLYKIKDVVSITEEVSGRIVSLNAYAKFSTDENNLESRCPTHAPSNDEEGWAEKEAGTQLPSVNIALSVLGPNLKQVLKDHKGSAPLYTIMHCYNANLNFEPLTEDTIDGVPLEHLISAVKGLQIVSTSSGVKSIVIVSGDEELSNASMSGHGLIASYGVNSGSTSSHMGILPPGPGHLGFQGPPSANSLGHLTLTNQLNQLSRYLVDLLKAQQGTRILFQRFIPAYHHQFGTQLRVADYGYTKLKDLLEALPNVIQIIGEGSKSVITLTHRHQVKRFQSDLLKILKGLPNKQVALSEFPKIYEKTFKREFRVTDYGVCDIDDLLHEISETSVAVSKSGDDILIEVPKREQTLDELERTQTFAEECKKLLRHAPECRIPFNKFIPSYHHHFGRQCRVSDYGFSKLVELFESIPQMVDITEDPDGERLIQLTDSVRLSVVGDQIKDLILITQDKCLTVEEMEANYKSNFGYQLRPDTFGYNSMMELLKTMNQVIRLEDPEDKKDSVRIRLIDRSYIKSLSKNVRSILTLQQDGQMAIEEFLKEYERRFHKMLDLKKLADDLPDLIEVLDENSNKKPTKATKEDGNNNNNGETLKLAETGDPQVGAPTKSIRLVPLQLCVARITELIKEHDKLYCSDLEALFAEKYKTPLSPGQYGYPNIKNLLESGLAKYFTIRGRGPRKVICIAKDTPERPSTDYSAAHQSSKRDFDHGSTNLAGPHRGFSSSSSLDHSSAHLHGSRPGSLSGQGDTTSFPRQSYPPAGSSPGAAAAHNVNYSSHYNMDLLRLARPRHPLPSYPGTSAPAEPLFPFPPPHGGRSSSSGFYQLGAGARDHPYYGSMSREAAAAAAAAYYRDDYVMHAAAAAMYRAELAAAAAAYSPHAPPRGYMNDLAKYNVFPGGGSNPRDDLYSDRDKLLLQRTQNLSVSSYGEVVPPNSPSDSVHSAEIRHAAAAAISQLNSNNNNNLQGKTAGEASEFYD